MALYNDVYRHEVESALMRRCINAMCRHDVALTLMRRCINDMCCHDVVSMLMRRCINVSRRHDVAPALMRRCINALCPLGTDQKRLNNTMKTSQSTLIRLHLKTLSHYTNTHRYEPGHSISYNPVSILHKSKVGRYRPVRVADNGPL